MSTIAEIQAKYEAQFKQLQEQTEASAEKMKEDGDRLEKDAKTKFKVDIVVRWVDRRIIMNLPQVTMRSQTFKLDLPEVKGHLQEMIFHTPSTRMVLKKVGQYPEVHGLKIVWKDILTEVPEIFMQEQRIKIEVPEVRMTTQELRVDYPDFSWGPTEFVLRLPEFEVKDISFVVPIDDDDTRKRSAALKARGEELGAQTRQRAEELAASMRSEILTSSLASAKSLSQTAGAAFATQSSEVTRSFAEGLQRIDTLLAEHGSHLSPDQTIELQNQRNALAAKGEEAAKAVSEASTVLSSERKELDV